MYKPFMVKIHLATPMVVGDNDTFLDALLAWCMVNESKPQSQEKMDAIHYSLPLEKHEANGQWVWKASKLIPAQNGMVDSRFFTRRFDTDKVVKMRRGDKILLSKREGNDLAISQGSGPYRGMLEYYHVEDVKTLICYGVGDIERVAELLGRLEYLGSKSRVCHGRIDYCEVIRLETMAECLWHLRPLPIDTKNKEGFIKKFYRLTPPYWKKNDKALVFYPL